jgi:hypothetical protein
VAETIVGIIAGLIVTIVISRYYYRLGSRHRLAIYVLQAFQVMSDLDPEIKKNFTVEFHDMPVKDLTVLELVIANEGTHSIRDCVEPLAATLPDGVSLLDVTVPYVNPEGRHVSAAVKSKQHFEYPFSILNPREYFFTKIVTDGYIDLDELSITIAADNLPPRIKPQFGERVETTKRTPIGVAVGIIGVVVYVFIGLYAVSILSLLRHANKALLPSWLHIPLPYPASMVATMTLILAISSVVLCLAFLLAALFGGTFPPSRRFPLPEALRGGNQPIRAALGLEIWRDRPGKPDETR